MAAYLFSTSANPPPSRTAGKLSSSLTQRETEVLKLVATGFTAKEIAGRLDLSLSSIETYKTRAADKLSIKGRAEIVRYASAQGWLASV
jgi:DNA-binding NarL/FixJ family response regulator